MINDTILLGMFGGYELVIVLAVVLLLFGGRKIPELMRGLGKGMKEFKNATNDIKEEINDIDPTKELRK